MNCNEKYGHQWDHFSGPGSSVLHNYTSRLTLINSASEGIECVPYYHPSELRLWCLKIAWIGSNLGKCVGNRVNVTLAIQYYKESNKHTQKLINVQRIESKVSTFHKVPVSKEGVYHNGCGEFNKEWRRSRISLGVGYYTWSEMAINGSMKKGPYIRKF